MRKNAASEILFEFAAHEAWQRLFAVIGAGHVKKCVHVVGDHLIKNRLLGSVALVGELGFIHKQEELAHNHNKLEMTSQMSAADIFTLKPPSVIS